MGVREDPVELEHVQLPQALALHVEEGLLKHSPPMVWPGDEEDNIQRHTLSNALSKTPVAGYRCKEGDGDKPGIVSSFSHLTTLDINVPLMIIVSSTSPPTWKAYIETDSTEAQRFCCKRWDESHIKKMSQAP